MGGIDEALIYGDVTLAVDRWERSAIANTDIDGPLSTFAKTSLINTLAELLAEKLKSGHPVEQEKRGPGRPKRVY